MASLELLVDIVKEGIDAAVRVGPLADSGLAARTFDQLLNRTYASPAYLARAGVPAAPGELAAHACLLYRVPSNGRSRPWAFRSGGRDSTLLPEGDVRLGDLYGLIQAAVDGLGIIQVPARLGTPEVKRGTLTEVLQAYRPPAQPVSLVYPSHRYIPLRVRVLADALVERYGTRKS